MNAPASSQEADRGRLMRLATYAAVATACTLIVVKLAAWVLTDSVALLSTLIDSTLDAAASFVNLVAVRHALQPADQEHRFGHGKAEPLAGLGQAAFIAGSALFLIIEASGRVFNPVPVTRGEVGIGVMLFSIALTIALVAFQKRVVAKTDSVAVGADSLHYAGDVLINISVIVSIALATLFGLHWLDPLFAIGIAGYLLYNAAGVFRGSFDLLMDREFPDEDRTAIRAIATAHPEVRNMHDLRTRSAGHYGFIQLHLEMDPRITLARAHAISDEVEAQIRAAFPHAEVIIHQDPAGIQEEHPTFG